MARWIASIYNSEPGAGYLCLPYFCFNGSVRGMWSFQGDKASVMMPFQQVYQQS
jgi:hypothetical protein